MVDLATASFPALGTTAAVVTRPAMLTAAVSEVERELEAIDRACSRFRDDSDLFRLNEAGGAWIEVDDLLLQAVGVALRAARLTDGLVDPTVGEAMMRIGYDRDFSRIVADGPASARTPSWIWTAGWRRVELRPGRGEIRMPRGMRIDLGSTAKALAADRAAASAAAATGCGVLVSLGGDVALGGGALEGAGWPVGIADDHAGTPEPGETIAIASGGLATSSTTIRRWSRGGVPVHHIVDPRTGAPAREVWRTVSVCAATCVDANTASTAAIVFGDEAPDWLARQGLPARLVGADGSIVRVAGWPERAAA
jgi:thiamine biosynthesis lipoprotein